MSNMRGADTDSRVDGLLAKKLSMRTEITGNTTQPTKGAVAYTVLNRLIQ